MLVKRYNKLVRDKIPEICRKNGAVPKTRIAKSKKEFIDYLCKKVLEEATELSQERGSRPEIAREIADLEEVLFWLAKTIGVSPKGIAKIRKEKNRTRGAFKKKIILLFTKE
jgi:predicted house-cleaning noncanonical NTP pyrophosphatase (MazG superfamily)